MGGAESTLTPEQMQRLRSELQALKKRQHLFFWISTVVAGLIFIGLAGLVLANLKNPESVSTYFGGGGVALGGVLVWMHNLWKSKIATDFILSLADVLDRDSLQSILNSLLEKL